MKNDLNNRILSSPHSLIAGTTGSGKSVLLNSVICTAYENILESNQSGEIILIDLKRVELSRYKNNTFTAGFFTEPEEVTPTLEGAIEVMNARYEYMEEAGLRLWPGKPAYIFIDELAYTVQCPGAMNALVTIGRLGRAAKIHLICATQDPSRATLAAPLMQNFTCCVALRCRSAIESRQIIGIAGAEQLPKYGKCILWDADGYTKYNVPNFTDEQADELCAFFRK